MMMRILTPFIIILFLPFAVLNYVYKNMKKVLIAVFVVIVFAFPFCCVTCDNNNVIEDDIVDYTYAFNTGVKRTSETKYIVLHHVAGTAKISDIAKIHLQQNGWNGIGYHFFIDTDGKVYKLRDTDEKAPHTMNYNSNAIGICFNGNLSVSEPTSKQWDSGLKLVRKLMEQYSLGKDCIKRHGELNTTECCGRYFDTEKFKEEI